MFDLDILTRLDTGLDRISPRQGISPTVACPRMARAAIEDVVRCPQMLARGVCPVAHREEVPA